MRLNRKTGGLAERILRERLAALGLAFRIHARDVVGHPDLVFDDRKLCVFCDGDFWHGRRWGALRVRLQDRSNAAYWLAKIASNRNRDRRVNIELRRAGWKVVRIWEGDLLRAPDLAAARVVATLNTR